MIAIPRLYAIIDADSLAPSADPLMALAAFARELVAAGVTLIQYRNKSGSAREMLVQARELRRVVAAATRPGRTVRLIMNDRADLCLAADFDGVHVGQDDLSPEAARAVVGAARWVGVSTHNPEQVREADRWPVDYIAVGPVYATSTKANPDPVIGLEGVRTARALTAKPLVAIGGISRANACDVIAAGADSVAVISDLRRGNIEEFIRKLG